ncbi:alpha/beta fold hydrolase [Marinobacter sp. X15-166B]|uniref:alpha/beta fold hydrolase n=1 Tax=Marinobacter sp. X15-166B TaxID=1897620 RepID=UPI00085CCD63|nr:alpha/beta hydrolase [Marinobacter sp. X15-166B]OEY67492.1 alpha/beta hydrolase [Marinobacter sp. X15-166B]
MSSTSIEQFSIDVPGGQVFAKKWTPETDSGKPPLILLHDSLGSVGLWRDFPALLAKTLARCVIAYDRLGYGHSAARDTLPSVRFIDEEASVYFPVLKHQLGIEQYVLLGHSVGGGMAIHIAAEDPDCQAVVTVAAQAFVEHLTRQGIEDARQMFAQPGQLDRLKKWHGDKACWVLRAWTDIWLSPEFAQWSLEPALRKVQCPVLALHGDGDEYGSAAFPEFIAEHAGGPATAVLLDNCGHMPHREQPEEVLAALKGFLD